MQNKLLVLMLIVRGCSRNKKSFLEFKLLQLLADKLQVSKYKCMHGKNVLQYI